MFVLEMNEEIVTSGSLEDNRDTDHLGWEGK